MGEPKSVREVNFVIDAIERRLGLLQVLIIASLGMLGGLVAGAIAIYLSTGEIKTNVAVAHAKLDGVASRLSTVENELRDVRARDRQILDALLRIEAKQGTAPIPSPLSITAGDAEFIRKVLGTPPRIGVSKFAIGDQAPADAKLLPEEIVSKIPKLKGVTFVLDGATNTLGLIDPNTRLIFALI